MALHVVSGSDTFINDVQRDSVDKSFLVSLQSFNEQSRKFFDSIREELEEHCESINDNTNEIQTNYEYIGKLDRKLDQLAERMDKMQVFLQQHHGFAAEKLPRFNVMPLSKKEKEVFLLLYAMEETRKEVAVAELAKRLSMSENLVQNFVMNLVEKGVPILKKYVQGKSYLFLNKDFKELQAKENILDIEQKQLS